MIVRTKSDKAVKAQKSVMEFLLINHPLDCPICDQGGECQLQDLAVGYGGNSSRYEEEKRVVFHKDVGPLVSMEEMSRCIHCTRCVRFGQEIAGVMELGMSHRGEHAEIETFVGHSIDSELSGNMIDICPVGALTSKPFRYSARTWELSRRKSVSPHDSAGANLIVQVKNNRVMRVVPLENDDVNECWIADRDRFSYEALNGEERLTSPMLKQGGVWKTVDWKTALEYVAHGLQSIKANHGPSTIGALVSPHSTLEELYLAGTLMRGLGSENIDFRLRNVEFAARVGCWVESSQGPSTVRTARAPSSPCRLRSERHQCIGRGLGDASAPYPSCAVCWVGAGLGRYRSRHRHGEECQRSIRGKCHRPGQGHCEFPTGRGAQGYFAWQCRCAPFAGRAIAGFGKLDWRAYRGIGGIPHRGSQHGWCATCRRHAR
jgi:predicted molibdopterin-dependent oxidoreductase YjgC